MWPRHEKNHAVALQKCDPRWNPCGFRLMHHQMNKILCVHLIKYMQYLPVAYNTGSEFRSRFPNLGKLRFRNQDRETLKAPMTRAHRRDISVETFT